MNVYMKDKVDEMSKEELEALESYVTERLAHLETPDKYSTEGVDLDSLRIGEKYYIIYPKTEKPGSYDNYIVFEVLNVEKDKVIVYAHPGYTIKLPKNKTEYESLMRRAFAIKLTALKLNQKIIPLQLLE